MITGRAAGTDENSLEPGTDALGLGSSWWLHPRERPAAICPKTRDVLREFATMATQLGLAAWLLGLALTSSCDTVVPGYGATTAQGRVAEALGQRDDVESSSTALVVQRVLTGLLARSTGAEAGGQHVVRLK